MQWGLRHSLLTPWGLTTFPFSRRGAPRHVPSNAAGPHDFPSDDVSRCDLPFRSRGALRLSPPMLRRVVLRPSPPVPWGLATSLPMTWSLMTFISNVGILRNCQISEHAPPLTSPPLRQTKSGSLMGMACDGLGCSGARGFVLKGMQREGKGDIGQWAEVRRGRERRFWMGRAELDWDGKAGGSERSMPAGDG
jgi:hypothetical protein